MEHKCTIRGHDHKLVLIKEHTQVGTGDKAVTVECPNGNYRWFLVGDIKPSEYNRQKRPHWGWKN